VRAADEAEDPAAAVGAVLESFSQALAPAARRSAGEPQDLRRTAADLR
jgi:hypothetical protein